MPITYNVRLDDRRIKKDGTYPVKVWVTYERRALPYSTIYNLSKSDWDKLNASNLREELRTIRDGIRKLEIQLQDYLQETDEFSFENFEIAFVIHNKFMARTKVKNRGEEVKFKVDDLAQYEKRFKILKEEGARKGNLLYCYQKYIIELLKNRQTKTASVYQSAYNSLVKYKGIIEITQVTEAYLNGYESWMKGKEENKATSVGIWVRTLRRLIKVAIKQGVFLQSKFPFGRDKYVIPSKKNAKDAFDVAVIPAVYHFKTTSEWAALSRDAWLFMYFGNGMNMKDLCLLRYPQYVGDYITFERAKIERTAKDRTEEIVVYVNEIMKAIIERWGNPRGEDGNNYIFPFYEEGMNDMDKYIKLEDTIKITNRWMRKIFGELKLDFPSNTKMVRNSMATHLLYNGASTEFIKGVLGHQNITTTQIYLSSFKKPVVKEHAEKLVTFDLNLPDKRTA
ncbi:site-specific recombinase XerD [Filimonas zeae]|uniref:Integrase n=1 Tax=Filimonas zeae TaxID=1737353 RepID=A0A917IPC1_9BACT|nr:site-specific integrase [Filimonas zeae]MDR6337647.1 site-specific recombinase XerD [Filimonas zeae]GGH59621.1 integrase [Filimonas zeae]